MCKHVTGEYVHGMFVLFTFAILYVLCYALVPNLGKMEKENVDVPHVIVG